MCPIVAGLRRCLFIAYHFPPIGLSGVQRTVKFVRYLPDFGWEPSILTGPGDVSVSGLPRDETLAAELPGDTRITRLGTSEPMASSGNRARAERWLRLERPWQRWWVDGVAEAGRGDAAHAEVIVASMSPFESAEAAARLAASSGTPWVADLRDPWALDEMLAYPTRVHRAREMTRMRCALGTAAAIVMNTPEAARAVRRAFPELDDRPIVAITNGYDKADFDGPEPELDPVVFRIAHTGSFHTAAGVRRRTKAVRHALGGTIGGIDFLPRSHVYLVEAIRRVTLAEPTLRGSVRVLLAGVMTAEDRSAADIPEVEELGYLAHDESVGVLRSSDLLFLPMHDVARGYRSRIVPGKTYEYLASQRPILAAVPDGDARELLAQTPTGLLCEPDDIDAMVRIILRQIRQKADGVAAPRPPAELLRRYERCTLTGQLAALLDEVAAAGQRARRNQKLPGLPATGS